MFLGLDKNKPYQNPYQNEAEKQHNRVTLNKNVTRLKPLKFLYFFMVCFIAFIAWLLWGSRGREFKSRHSDQYPLSNFGGYCWKLSSKIAVFHEKRPEWMKLQKSAPFFYYFSKKWRLPRAPPFLKS